MTVAYISRRRRSAIEIISAIDSILAHPAFMAKRVKHEIAAMVGGMVVCKCHWQYRETHQKDFGPRSLIDALLDRYNAHRAQAASDEA